MQVRHRRDWRWWRRRRCICGLRWPCLELHTGPADPPPRPAGTPRHPGWNTQTVGWPQVGRAGRLTPAQQHRANGGRW